MDVHKFSRPYIAGEEAPRKATESLLEIADVDNETPRYD